jgi:hypothetical protein
MFDSFFNTAYVYRELISEYRRRGYPIVEEKIPTFLRTEYVIDYNFLTRLFRRKNKLRFQDPKVFFDFVKSEKERGVNVIEDVHGKRTLDNIILNGTDRKYHIERKGVYEDL